MVLFCCETADSVDWKYIREIIVFIRSEFYIFDRLPSLRLPNTHFGRASASGAARCPSANQTRRCSRFPAPSAHRDAFLDRRLSNSDRSLFRPPRSLSLQLTMCTAMDYPTAQPHGNGRTTSS